MNFRGFETIEIKGSPAYEASVAALLEKLWATWTGWAVLRELIDTGKALTIVPYSAEDQKKLGPTNAFATAMSSRQAIPRGLWPGRTDDPKTPQDERFRPRPFSVGLGGGSASAVHFSPDTWQAALPTCSKKVTSGCLPPMYAQNRGADDILAHELVHSLRQMRGQITDNPTRTARYDNEEEYFAVLIQNVYASEKGMTILRSDHRGHSALKSSLATSASFLGKDDRPLGMDQLENRLLVGKFVKENFGLCQKISSRVNAVFNPIGEFMRNPPLYRYDPTLTFAGVK